MALQMIQMSSVLSNVMCGDILILGHRQCFYKSFRNGPRAFTCCAKGLRFSRQLCRCVVDYNDLNSLHGKNFNRQISLKTIQRPILAESAEKPTQKVRKNTQNDIKSEIQEIPREQNIRRMARVDPNLIPRLPRTRNTRQRRIIGQRRIINRRNMVTRLPPISYLYIRQRNGLVLQMPAIFVLRRNLRGQLIRSPQALYIIRNGQYFFHPYITRNLPALVNPIRQAVSRGAIIKPTLVNPRTVLPNQRARRPIFPTGSRIPPSDISNPSEDSDGSQQNLPDQEIPKPQAPLSGTTSLPPIEPQSDGSLPPESVKELKNTFDKFPFVLTTKGGNKPIDALTGQSLVAATLDGTLPSKSENEGKKEFDKFPFVLSTKGGNTPIDASTGQSLVASASNIALPSISKKRMNNELDKFPSVLTTKGGNTPIDALTGQSLVASAKNLALPSISNNKMKNEFDKFPHVLTTKGGNTPIDALTGQSLIAPANNLALPLKSKTKMKNEFDKFPHVLTTKGGNTPIDALTGQSLIAPANNLALPLKSKTKMKNEFDKFPHVLTTKGGNTPIDALTGQSLIAPASNIALPSKIKKEIKSKFPHVLTTKGGNAPIDALTGQSLIAPLPDFIPEIPPKKQGATVSSSIDFNPLDVNFDPNAPPPPAEALISEVSVDPVTGM